MKNIIIFLSGLLIGYFLLIPSGLYIGSLGNIWHPTGYLNSPSKISGRAGYYFFRPFSNRFVNWFDIGIPVAE